MQSVDEVNLVAQFMEDEFASFFASFEESAEAKATILMFPADLVPYLTKWIKYDAPELNLGIVYIKDKNQRSIAICPKHYLKAGIDTTNPEEPIDISEFKKWIDSYLISINIEPEGTLSQISDLKITDIEEESDAKQIAKSFDKVQVDQTSTRRRLFTERDIVSDTCTSPIGNFGSDSSLDSLEAKMLSNFSDGEDSNDSDDNINVVIRPSDRLFEQDKSGDGPCMQTSSADNVDHLLDSSSFVSTSEDEYDPYVAWKKLGFMIELYNIPKTYSTNSLLSIYREKPRYIKWCDDNHALLVTGSGNQAHRALFVRHPIVRSRAMIEASSLAVTTADKCKLTPAVFQKAQKTMKNLQCTTQGDAEAASNVESTNNKMVKVHTTDFKNHEIPTFGKGRKKLTNCLLNIPITHDHVATLWQWGNFRIEEEPLVEQFINTFKGNITIVVAIENYNQIQNEMYSKMKSVSNETVPTDYILNAPLNKFGETTPVDMNNTFVGASRLTDLANKYFKEPVTIVMPRESIEPYQEMMSQEMEYIIELYNIPKIYKIQDILSVYKEKPCYIKRCDDTHALLVTGSPEQAKRALSINSSVIKSRSMIMSSSLATSVALRYNLPPAMENKNQRTDHNVQQHFREEQVEFVDKVIEQDVDDVVQPLSGEDHSIQEHLREVASKQAEEFVDDVFEQAMDHVVQSLSGQGHNIQQQLREIASKQAEELVDDVMERSVDIIEKPFSEQDSNIQQLLREIASRQPEKFVDKIIEQTLNVIIQPPSGQDHDIQQHLKVVASEQADEFIEEGLGKVVDVILEPDEVSSADDRVMQANTEQTDNACEAAKLEDCEAAELEDIEWEGGMNYEEWY